MGTYTVVLDDGRKYDIEADRQPTPEEAQSAISDFHARPTSEQSFTGGFARGIGPGIAGTLGGTGGTALGIALAPETGGLSLLLPVAGAIAGGLTGYSLGKTGQDLVANKYAPDSVFGTKAEQADVQTNPGSEMLGNFLSMGRPNPTNLYRAGQSILTTEGRAAISKAIDLVRRLGPEAAGVEDPMAVNALNHVLHIAGNAGVGAAQGAMEGQTPGDIALNTAGMMLFNDGWLHSGDHATNVDRFRTALGEPATWTGENTPPEAQNAQNPVGGGKEGIPSVAADFRQPENSFNTEEQAHQEVLDNQHQQLADVVTNNAVAKEQDAVVPQLAQADAPLTAAAVADQKESSRDVQVMEGLQKGAEDHAQIEHDAEQKQLEAILKQKEEEGIAKHESDTKAAEKAQAEARTAPEPVKPEPAKSSQPAPEKVAPVAGDVSDLTAQLRTAEDHLSNVQKYKVDKGTLDLAQKSVDDLKAQIQSKVSPPEEAKPQKTEPVKERPQNLTKDLAGAKPRYGYRDKNFGLKFESDVDKAAYITARASKSAAHDRYLKFAKEATGLSEKEITAHGKKVSNTIKGMAKSSNAEELVVPKHEISKLEPKEVPVKPEPKKQDENTSKSKVSPAPEAKQGDSSPPQGDGKKGKEVTKPQAPAEVPVKAPAEPVAASKPEPSVKTAEATQGFTKSLSEHLGEQSASKWKPEDFHRAEQYIKHGDQKAYEELSGPKRSAVTRYAETEARDVFQKGQAEARKAAGETFTSEDGTKYKQDPAYNAKEGKGDDIVDYLPETEDPETGHKNVYAVARGQSVEEPTKESGPKPTEKHPFVYKLHNLFNKLPSGKEQFAGATIGEHGNISRDVWNSKTKNISKEEKGLYESLVPEAFKGDKVNVRLLNDRLKDLPSVEVHTYGMEPKEDIQKTALDKLTHEWFDNLDNDTYNKVVDYTHLGEESALDGLDQDTIDTAKEFKKLTDEFKEFGGDRNSGPRATQYYKSISPFDTEKYPVQRIDVVLPTKKAGEMFNGQKLGPDETGNVLWPEDNLHENLPNTLGWAMVQYVPHPVTGEKTMFIGELQSRWGQERAKVEKLSKDAESGRDIPESEWGEGERVPDHPLLKSWESLALKAVIDTARREGVSKVILSDAESAMMTEGHDKAGRSRVDDMFIGQQKSVEPGTWYVTKAGSDIPLSGASKDRSRLSMWENDPNYEIKQLKPEDFVQRVEQEGGMRAQYDKRGPDILRKITGDQGKQVDLGVHKNSRGTNKQWQVVGADGDVFYRTDDLHLARDYAHDERGATVKEYFPGSPVFKTSEGTPRTNVGGKEYDISNLSDTANQYSAQKGSGANSETAQKALDAFTERNPFIKGKIFLHDTPESLTQHGAENPAVQKSMKDAVDLINKGMPVAGFVDSRGNIHIITSKSPTSQSGLERLMAHEVFHRGEDYARIYAPEDYAALQKLKAQIKDQHLAELGDNEREYKHVYGDWRTNEESRAALQTEWITRQIERGALESSQPDSLWGKIKEVLSRIWAKVTGNNNPTDKDIQEMYRAMQNAQTGKVNPRSPFTAKYGDFKAGVARDVYDRTKEATEDTIDRLKTGTKGAATTVVNTLNSIHDAGKGTPKFTEAKKAVGDFQAAMQVSGAKLTGELRTFVKEVPSARKRAAITVYRQADGDMATLQKWEQDTVGVNKDFSRAAKEAQNLDTKGEYWAQQMSDWYEDQGNRAVASGHLPQSVMQNGSDTYANGVWQKKITAAGRDAYNQFIGKLQRNFNFGKKASFENFYEGVMAGFKPKTLDQAHLYSLYTNHLNKVIHSNDFIKNFAAAKAQDGRPMAVIKGADVTSNKTGGGSKILDSTVAKRILDDENNPIPYKSSQDPRLWGWKWMGTDSGGKDVMMKGNLAFHPEGFKIIDNLLRRSALKEWASSPSESATAEILKRGFSAVDSINSGVKMGMFGFSPFHMVQEGTQAIGHRINPLTDLHDFDPGNADHVDAIKHGLVLPGTEGQDNDLFEGLTSSGWLHKIPVAGPVAKFVSDKTWQYVRSLKLKAYEQVLDTNKKTFAKDIASGKTSLEDIKHLSATQMNESFGGQNYQMMGRNPTVQHILRLGLLAPDFLESRFRASASAVHGLTGAKAGREQAVALGALAMVSYAIARILNSALNNGDTKADHPFSVISGNREYTMRSLPEDIYKMVTDPRKFAMGRISPFITKTAVELGTGRNYRGESISAAEALKNTALAGLPMSMRDVPGLSQLTQTTANNPVSPLESLMSTFGLHISKFSPVNKAYEIANAYKEKIGKPDTGVYPVSQYSPLKNALEDVDTAKAATEITKLRKTMKPDELAKSLHESIFHSWMPNAKDDIAFQKSLSPEDKAVVKAAESRKIQIWRRFVKLSHTGGSLPVGMPVHKS